MARRAVSLPTALTLLALVMGLIAVSEAVHLRTATRDGFECGDAGEVTPALVAEGKVCCKVADDEWYITPRENCKPATLIAYPTEEEEEEEAPALAGPLYVSPSEAISAAHIDWARINLIPVKSDKAMAAVYSTPRGRGKFFLKLTCDSGTSALNLAPNPQSVAVCGDNAAATQMEHHFMSKFCTDGNCSGDRQSFTKTYGVAVPTSGPFSGKHILVSELVSSSFGDEVKKPRTLPESLDIAVRLLRGVAMMHEANVAHLDFKQDNLRWDPESEYKVKIFDWDISRDGSVQYPYPQNLNGLQTTMQVLLSGDDVTAPRNADYWKRIDMFPVGAVILDILIGNKPAKSSPDSWIDANVGEMWYDCAYKVYMEFANENTDARDIIMNLLSKTDIDPRTKAALADALAPLFTTDVASRPTATDLLGAGIFQRVNAELTQADQAAAAAEIAYEARRVSENTQDGARLTETCRRLQRTIAEVRGSGDAARLAALERSYDDKCSTGVRFNVGAGSAFAYIEKRAPSVAPETQREYEFPYEKPDNELVLGRDGPVFKGAANFGDTKEAPEKRVENLFKGTLEEETYLWVLTEDGQFIIGKEDDKKYTARPGEVMQELEGTEFMIPMPRGRKMKHGDLNPTNDGHHRSEARMGGQFTVGTSMKGDKVWVMDNDSSYCYNRADGIVLHWRSLYAAAKLLGEYGVDVQHLFLKDTSQLAGNDQVALPMHGKTMIRLVGEGSRPVEVAMDSGATVGDAIDRLTDLGYGPSSRPGINYEAPRILGSGKELDRDAVLGDVDGPVFAHRRFRAYGGM